MTTDYDRLKAMLAETPYLAADHTTGKLRLMSRAETVKGMLARGEYPTATIVDLEGALTRFAKLRGVGEDRTFVLQDLATIMGLSYPMAHWYQRHGILKPSIERSKNPGHSSVFSWGDAFAAGLIGSLARHGVKPDMLKHVQPMLQGQKPKRTGRKGELAARS